MDNLNQIFTTGGRTAPELKRDLDLRWKNLPQFLRRLRGKLADLDLRTKPRRQLRRSVNALPIPVSCPEANMRRPQRAKAGCIRQRYSPPWPCTPCALLPLAAFTFTDCRGRPGACAERSRAHPRMFVMNTELSSSIQTVRINCDPWGTQRRVQPSRRKPAPNWRYDARNRFLADSPRSHSARALGRAQLSCSLTPPGNKLA